MRSCYDSQACCTPWAASRLVRVQGAGQRAQTSVSSSQHGLQVQFKHVGSLQVQSQYVDGMQVRFKYVDDLASVWCEWAEMELQHKQFKRALDLMRSATATPVTYDRRKVQIITNHHPTLCRV